MRCHCVSHTSLVVDRCIHDDLNHCLWFRIPHETCRPISGSMINHMKSRACLDKVDVWSHRFTEFSSQWGSYHRALGWFVRTFACVTWWLMTSTGLMLLLSGTPEFLIRGFKCSGANYWWSFVITLLFTATVSDCNEEETSPNRMPVSSERSKWQNARFGLIEDNNMKIYQSDHIDCQYGRTRTKLDRKHHYTINGKYITISKTKTYISWFWERSLLSKVSYFPSCFLPQAICVRP